MIPFTREAQAAPKRHENAWAGRYEAEKQAWIAAHPEATAREYEQAIRAIAERCGVQVARIRSIKPDFWTDEKLTECSVSARLLFIGTWNFADDYGNLDRSAKQIKARVFPIDNLDCEPLLQELTTHGLLIEYSAKGKKYLHIKGFSKHQVINRPSSPQCPVYEDSVSAKVDSRSAHSGEEGRGEEGKAKRPLPEDWSPASSTVERLSREFGLVPEDVTTYVAAFRDACKAKGYKYLNFDSAFSNCVRQDWPKLRNGAKTMPKAAGAGW